jgi:hypothetical protein
MSREMTVSVEIRRRISWIPGRTFSCRSVEVHGAGEQCMCTVERWNVH